MITCRVAKILLVCLCCSFLFLPGCANFIKPEIGAIARQEARIDLVEGGVQDAIWSTKDLELTYSYSEAENTFSLSGKLVFDRSLTDSFRLTKRFVLKMNFLDGEGRVLETVDISPVVSSFGFDPDPDFSVKRSSLKPMGSSSIAFNYYGEFMGNDPEARGDSWYIFYFPFD